VSEQAKQDFLQYCHEQIEAGIQSAIDAATAELVRERDRLKWRLEEAVLNHKNLADTYRYDTAQLKAERDSLRRAADEIVRAATMYVEGDSILFEAIARYHTLTQPKEE